METYNNTKQILSKLEEISNKLDKIEGLINLASLKQTLKENLNDPIRDINVAVQAFENHGIDALREHQAEFEISLFKAYLTLSNVFIHNGDIIFESYKAVLALEASSNPDINRIQLTQWFRQMLDYQIIAFGLYIVLHYSPDQKDQINQKVQEFQAVIIKQIKANSGSIDTDLIYQYSKYIALQLEKSKTRQQARQLLIPS